MRSEPDRRPPRHASETAAASRVDRRTVPTNRARAFGARLQNSNLQALKQSLVRMIWTSPSRRRRTEARPRHAMMAAQSASIIGRPECVTQNTNRSFEFASGVLARPAPRLSRALFLNEIGAIMKIVRFVRSQAHAIYALVAVFLGAVALAALGSFVPDQALSALRSLIPGETPFLQLLLLGWMGVGLGRLTIKPTPTPAESGAGPSRGETRPTRTATRTKRSTGCCARWQRCCRPI